MLIAVVVAVLVCTAPLAASAQTRDGSHDLDFSIGRWTVDISRIADPFLHPDASTKMAGVITVSPLWGGKALIEEMEVDGQNGHWEGMNLFLYNPQARQWSKLFANSRTGQTESPLIGSFDNGIGEFFTMDSFENRSVITRARWFNLSSSAYDYDEAYSADGGKSWHVAFRAHLHKAAG